MNAANLIDSHFLVSVSSLLWEGQPYLPPSLEKTGVIVRGLGGHLNSWTCMPDTSVGNPADGHLI